MYNRFGELVFETTEAGKKWDGKFKNIEQSTGAYVFSCRFVADDNQTYKIQGTFVLIR